MNDRLEDVPRAGRLACFCPPGLAPEEDEATPVGLSASGLGVVMAGFALSVLAQTLAIGLLPIAGLLLAPGPALSTAPYAALLLGAAVATFPASFLEGAFGRRAAFALGASHGVAGGLVMAWAVSNAHFVALCLGAFWLGVAQGFSLFYRHLVGLDARAGASRAMAAVFAAGAFAGLVGPALATFAAEMTPQRLYAGAALAAALAQVGVMALAWVAPTGASVASERALRAAQPVRWSALAAPTALGALSWFAMTAIMIGAPAAMMGCGVSAASATGAVAWHVVAMYAPVILVPWMAQAVGAPAMAAAGLALMALAKWLSGGADSYLPFVAALIVVAIGWAWTTAAATQWLHQAGRPSRAQLALHDALLFAAAVAGALAGAPRP
jgi:MFS family permease